jgi:hypothetical protein
MREIEINDYARQLLEAHGAKAIAEVLVALGCILPDGSDVARSNRDVGSWG